jgi:predicted DCC family thiol-disulfide oxidoreductase YuxK
MAMNEKYSEIEVIFDKACPLCNHFAGALKKSGNVTAIDARTDSECLREAEKLGLNIDQGLVVYAQKTFYYGQEAMQFIASNAQVNGITGLVNRYLLKHHVIARLVYPVLVRVRLVLLFLLGKPLIRRKR